MASKVMESKRRFVYDIETDNLLEDVTKINCIVLYDIDSGGTFRYPPDKVKIGLLRMYNAKMLIAHNQIGYDLEVIKKLYPKWRTKAQIYDTMILSQLFWPDIGSHGLEAWGERLGVKKPKVTDWSTDDIDLYLHRCNEDVKINFLLWLKCKRELDSWDWEGAIQLEQDVARIHAKQVHHGFYFNKRKALNLLGRLIKEIELIDLKIKPKMPMRCVKVHQGKPVTLLFLKTGGYRQNVINYFGEDVDKVRGAYSRVDIRRVKTSEAAQLKLYFLRVGWKPDTWNYKKVDGKIQRMSPKLTLSSLESSNITSEIGALLVRRMMLCHRRNIISSPSGKGLLPHIRKRDGRIASEAHTCGTPTARYRHMVIANFPRPSTEYGKDIRELFGVDPLTDKIMGSMDLAGIEARMMGHYCYSFRDGPELADMITDGDFHQKNADLWAVSRNTAKSGLYCLIFGGGAGKLASTLMKPDRLGTRLRDAFWEGNQPLKDLREAVEAAIKQNGGFVKGLDGRKVFIRDTYKALNSLFQGGAAVLFKRWLVMMDSMIEGKHLDVHQMCVYHDEQNVEASPEHAECYIEEGCKLALKAGEYYNLNVTTPADGALGFNWSEVH